MNLMVMKFDVPLTFSVASQASSQASRIKSSQQILLEAHYVLQRMLTLYLEHCMSFPVVSPSENEVYIIRYWNWFEQILY